MRRSVLVVLLCGLLFPSVVNAAEGDLLFVVTHVRLLNVDADRTPSNVVVAPGQVLKEGSASDLVWHQGKSFHVLPIAVKSVGEAITFFDDELKKTELSVAKKQR